MLEQLETTLILPPDPGVAEEVFKGLGLLLEAPRLSSFSEEHFVLSFDYEHK